MFDSFLCHTLLSGWASLSGSLSHTLSQTYLAGFCKDETEQGRNLEATFISHQEKMRGKNHYKYFFGMSLLSCHSQEYVTGFLPSFDVPVLLQAF